MGIENPSYEKSQRLTKEIIENRQQIARETLHFEELKKNQDKEGLNRLKERLSRRYEQELSFGERSLGFMNFQETRKEKFFYREMAEKHYAISDCIKEVLDKTDVVLNELEKSE